MPKTRLVLAGRLLASQIQNATATAAPAPTAPRLSSPKQAAIRLHAMELLIQAWGLPRPALTAQTARNQAQVKLAAQIQERRRRKMLSRKPRGGIRQ